MILLIGGAVAVFAMWVAINQIAEKAIKKMYYEMRKRYLHSIYVEWEKQPEKTREPYKKWKPREVENFNKLYQILFDRDIPKTARKEPKSNKKNSKKKGDKNERFEQSNCKTVQNDGDKKKI